MSDNSNNLSEDPIRHIYLFAKGWYARGYDQVLNPVPMMYDIQKIVRRAYCMDNLNNEDIFKIILPYVWNALAGPIDFEEMLLFLRKLLINIDKQREMTVMWWDEGLIRMFLVMLALQEGLQLGDPDPKIMSTNSTSKDYRRKGE